MAGIKVPIKCSLMTCRPLDVFNIKFVIKMWDIQVDFLGCLSLKVIFPIVNRCSEDGKIVQKYCGSKIHRYRYIDTHNRIVYLKNKPLLPFVIWWL